MLERCGADPIDPMANANPAAGKISLRLDGQTVGKGKVHPLHRDPDMTAFGAKRQLRAATSDNRRSST